MTAPTGTPETTGRPARRLDPRWLLVVGAVIVGYALLYWLFDPDEGPFSEIYLYTPGWTRGFIPPFFAPVTVIAALVGGRVAAIWSGASYLAGVILGELIGLPVYNAAYARLERLLQDPDYQQSWDATHPGWWICILIFLVGTVWGVRQGTLASAKRRG